MATVTTQLNVSNLVYKGTVAVEFDSLDSSYAVAYGEPKVDLSGSIPFIPPSPQQPPGQIELSLETDLGTVPVAGSATEVAGLGGDLEVVGSGTFPTALDDTNAFFKHAEEVVGDFEMKTRIDAAWGGLITNGTDPATVDGFRIGLALYDGDESDDPSVILGWGSHNSAFNIALWERANKGGAYNEVNTVAKSSPSGIWLRFTRESAALTCEYSLDNGETWATIGAVTLSKQVYRVGLIVSSGDTTAVTAQFSGTSLTNTPVEDVNSFTIEGSNQVYLRSQSPHTFSLDGKVDPLAEHKVIGWMEEIKNRISTAMTDLRTNPNPVNKAGIEVENI